MNMESVEYHFYTLEPFHNKWSNDYSIFAVRRYILGTSNFEYFIKDYYEVPKLNSFLPWYSRKM